MLISSTIDYQFQWSINTWATTIVVTSHHITHKAFVCSNEGRLCISIERGPIVYCAEWPDNQGFDIMSILENREPQFAEGKLSYDGFLWRHGHLEHLFRLR